MKIAIPCWREIVSPVFDVACTLLLVEAAHGRELHRQIRQLSYSDPLVRQIVLAGVNTLICGAISSQLAFMLRSSGVQVISNICGAVDEVLSAFLRGALDEAVFLMPGCQGQRRRSRNRYRS